MDGPLIARQALQWSVSALAVIFLLIAVLVVAAASVDANHFRGPLIRFATARTGRQIRIDGSIEARLLSRTPRLIAQRVTIGNPPWMPPGTLAEIGRLSLAFDLPLFAHSFGIHRLEMEGATLHLARDSAARANWQWQEPGKPGKGPPLIRSLSMPDARVELNDDRQHLKFDGTVTAHDVPAQGGPNPLRIEGAGRLNGRPATFAVNGDPLATASHGTHYRFTFDERSSGSRLIGRGFLLQPFDLSALDTTFEATGGDLKDLYFLVGLGLPDTGTYRLTGRLARRNTNFKFTDLLATSGQSDMRGTVTIEDSTGRPEIQADLHSQLLRLPDLGAWAAGRVSESQATKPLLLPDTPLPFRGMRGSDAVVNFHARSVDIGRVSLHAVAAKVTTDHGVLAVGPLSAAFPEGKITGHVKVDATHDMPTADLDLRIADLRLSQFYRKDKEQPPLDGLLGARLTLTGHGRSIHELAASANGTVTAVLPHGAIRASFAELSGIDFRGLGLLLAKNKNETDIHCGVASFQVHGGNLTSQTLVVDTDPVLITGSGAIHLDSEALDLSFRGKPKSLRLRLRSAVSVRGTLKHPSIGIEAGKSAAQAGAAVALGVVLTPLAAILAFVDPGLAKDANCSALIAAAKTNGAPVSATTPEH